MANELTRKGIAFGAAVALGSTLIAGGAANAALNPNLQDLELTVADFAESNGVLATTSEDDFGLVLGWNSDVNTQNFDDLTYDIVFTDADDEDGEGYGWSGTTYGYYDSYEDIIETNWQSDGCYADMQWDAPHAGGTSTDTEDEGGIGYTGPVPAWDVTNYYAEDEDGEFSYWGAPTIEFGACYTPDEKMVATVQAFVDTNRNGNIDSGETYSAPVAVTFWNPGALTPVLALENDGMVYSTDGEDTIGWEVTFAEPLNDVWTGDYTGENNWGEDWYDDNYVWANGNLEIESYSDNVEIDTDYAYPEYNEDVLFDSGDVNYDVTDGAEDIGSAVNKVRASLWNEETDTYTYTAWQTVTVVEPVVEDVDGYVVEQDYVKAINEDDAVSRSDVDALEYVIEFTDVDEDAAPGVKSTTYVYAWGGYDGADYFEDEDDAQDWLDVYGVKVNGVEGEISEVVISPEDTDYEIIWEVDATSDADGLVTLDITSDYVLNEDWNDDDLYLYVDSVDFEGTSEDIYGDLYWEDTYYDLEFESGVDDEDTYDAPVGGNFTFDVYAADQWGHAPEQDLRLEVNNEDGRGDWDYIYPAFNSNGVATVVLEDTDATGEEGTSYYYDVDLQVKEGSGWDDIGFDGDEDLYIDWLADDATVSYVTGVSSDDSIEVTYGDWVSGNWHFFGSIDDDATDKIYWASHYTEISGYVHAENGYKIAGAAVTITGSGLFFEDDEGDLFGSDKIEVVTNENGYYEVWVYAHEVGEHTVTVTAAGKSTTVDVLVNDAELYASAVAVSPFTGKAGTSETITATVTDKWGNLVPEVDVDFSVTGGGYFADDSDTTGGTANEDLEDIADAGYGQASEMLIIMPNEIGYGSTVTATIDTYDPFEGDFGGEDGTASGSLAAGATDSGKPAFWTKDLGDGTLKLYAKNIVGAGKIQFFHNGKEIAWIKAVDALDPKLRAANGSYYLVRTVKLVSGKNVLEIKDDGARVVRRVASK